MSEDPSENDFGDSFSETSEETPPPPEWSADGDFDASEALDGSSIAFDMARLWVKEHQKATMLGAFGVGVFIGVLLRD